MKNAFLILLFSLQFFSCGRNQMDATKLLAERDSIIEANRKQQSELNEIQQVIDIVTISLDSIAQQERIIYSPLEIRQLSKHRILENLKSFEELIQRQRTVINTLQDSLNQVGNTSTFKLRQMIAFLNEELAKKDVTIEKLRREITSKNKGLDKLKTNITTLQENVSSLQTENEIQKEALVIQDKTLNACYIKVGTKKELKEAGIITGGTLLQKAKINYNNLTPQKCTVIDIREVNEITLNSKRPKILSPVPSSDSYTIRENGNGTSTLRITNANKFWSVSSYLIIQL